MDTLASLVATAFPEGKSPRSFAQEVHENPINQEACNGYIPSESRGYTSPNEGLRPDRQKHEQDQAELGAEIGSGAIS